ncbi:unnamed protein product, partial [Penicillium discolor]
RSAVVVGHRQGDVVRPRCRIRVRCRDSRRGTAIPERPRVGRDRPIRVARSASVDSCTECGGRGDEGCCRDLVGRSDHGPGDDLVVVHREDRGDGGDRADRHLHADRTRCLQSGSGVRPLQLRVRRLRRPRSPDLQRERGRRRSAYREHSRQLLARHVRTGDHDAVADRRLVAQQVETDRATRLDLHASRVDVVADLTTVHREVEGSAVGRVARGDGQRGNRRRARDPGEASLSRGGRRQGDPSHAIPRRERRRPSGHRPGAADVGGAPRGRRRALERVSGDDLFRGRRRDGDGCGRLMRCAVVVRDRQRDRVGSRCRVGVRRRRSRRGGAVTEIPRVRHDAAVGVGGAASVGGDRHTIRGAHHVGHSLGRHVLSFDSDRLRLGR